MSLLLMEQLYLSGLISVYLIVNEPELLKHLIFMHSAIDTGAGDLSPGYKMAPKDIHVVIIIPIKTPQYAP